MHFARWNFNNKIVATTKYNNFPTQGNTKVHIVRKVNNHFFEVKHFYAHNGKNLQNHFSCNIMENEKSLLDFCKKDQIGK